MSGWHHQLDGHEFEQAPELVMDTEAWRPAGHGVTKAIRVVSSAYLRLLIFLLAILIAAYASSSPAFLMMYSAYKLNKQGDNMQP